MRGAGEEGKPSEDEKPSPRSRGEPGAGARLNWGISGKRERQPHRCSPNVQKNSPAPAPSGSRKRPVALPGVERTAPIRGPCRAGSTTTDLVGESGPVAPGPPAPRQSRLPSMRPWRSQRRAWLQGRCWRTRLNNRSGRQGCHHRGSCPAIPRWRGRQARSDRPRRGSGEPAPDGAFPRAIGRRPRLPEFGPAPPSRGRRDSGIGAVITRSTFLRSSTCASPQKRIAPSAMALGRQTT